MKKLTELQKQQYQLIGDYLTQLPSEELISHTKTDEQRNEWLRLRLDYRLLSVFWKERLSSTDNQLERIVDQKPIDPLIYENYKLRVTYLLRLWELIQVAEPLHRERYIKANIPFKYPFKSPFEMFIAFLQEEAEDEFLPCLQGYYEKSLPKMREMIDLGQKAHLSEDKLSSMNIVIEDQRNSIEKSTYKSLERKHFVKERRWYFLFITFCRIEGNSHRQIRDKFNQFMKAFYKLQKNIATSTRKRESPTWQKRYSYAWKKGRKVRVNKGGAYQG